MVKFAKGDEVRLMGNSKRLKELVRLHGDVWRVRRLEMSVQCFNGDPGVFIEALDGAHSRWVRPDEVKHAS